MPEPMLGSLLDQYFDLMGACAQGGAQAFGDAVLLIQVYLITCSAMLAALIIACCALLGDASADRLADRWAKRSEVALRSRLWERISAACWADRIQAYTRRDLRQPVALEWLERSER